MIFKATQTDESGWWDTYLTLPIQFILPVTHLLFIFLHFLKGNEKKFTKLIFF